MAGIDTYTGLDFSAEAIRIGPARLSARRLSRRRRADDVPFTTTSPHDVTVCTEVLEHVPDDHGILQRFSGRCLCTVPNFPYDSHVRHFKDVEEVAERYGQHFTTFDVWPLRGHHSRDQVYFLIDGVHEPNPSAPASSRTTTPPCPGSVGSLGGDRMVPRELGYSVTVVASNMWGALPDDAAEGVLRTGDLRTARVFRPLLHASRSHAPVTHPSARRRCCSRT